MASIVIPAYNGYEMTHSLLFDIYKNVSDIDEIIVVDDCSTDKKVVEGLAWWKTMFAGKMKVYVNEVNSGFLRSANFGVSKATSEIVMLISNDVQIQDRELLKKVQAGFVEDVPTLVGARLLDYDTGWNTFDGKTYPYLDGHFLAFRKSDWSRIGGFDTRYVFADFEDVDLSSEFIHAGGKLVRIDANIVHLGAQTYKYSPEREANTIKNQKIFFEKWKNR